MHGSRHPRFVEQCQHLANVEITDLDDFADEPISTLNLIVIPGSETATDPNIHATIKLSGGGIPSNDYTLDGELQLPYPELVAQ